MATRRHEILDRVELALERGGAVLEGLFDEDGALDLGFDGAAVPDAHAVFVSSVLGLSLGQRRPRLVRKLLDRQLASGGWALAPGLPAHLSTTVECYVALRAAGMAPTERALQRARQAIERAGGLEKTGGPARITLALLGLEGWTDTFVPPPELALLPPEAPVSLFRVGALLRLHLLPLVVLKALDAVVAPELGRELRSELDGRWAAPSTARPGPLRAEALAACQRLMVERLDEDGTLGGLLMATGWAAIAAKVLGLSPDHPLRAKTSRGLRSFVYGSDGRDIHVQVCRPTVRSTALGLQALRGARGSDEVVARARDWLLGQRADEHGDFELNGPRGPAMAWSIKPRSRRFPSLLDTLLVISALSDLEGTDPGVARAMSWIASMQRRDGGFALFDRAAATAPWLKRLPFGLLTHTLNDESSPEVTGQVLAASRAMRFLDGRQIERAVAFLARSQRSDGAWQGPFSVGFLPATSAALRGLATARAQASTSVRRGVDFLLDRQRDDGGWGESPEGVAAGAYIDLGRSSPTQTALALLGLIAAGGLAARAAVERGVWYLLWTQEPDGSWVEDDPTSASLAGVLHVHGPANRATWPLLALRAFLDR